MPPAKVGALRRWHPMVIDYLSYEEKKKGSANNKRGEEVNDSEGDIKFSEDG